MLPFFCHDQEEKKSWPKDCVWPQPSIYRFYFEPEWIPDALDEEAEDLLSIKDYYDELVEEGVLTEDYKLNEEYEFEEDDDPEGFEETDEDLEDAEDNLDEDDDEDFEDDFESFSPEIGEDYWDENGFDVEAWSMDLEEVLCELKFDNAGDTPVEDIEKVLRYSFVNQNLLRQAFTRRSFALEYHVEGCCEELEFLGDSILNSVVTKEIMTQFSEVRKEKIEAPFQSRYQEGDLTKLRIQFVCKEHLAKRCSDLGLDQYILYGAGDEPSESSREDVLEALIGAVTIDCGWDMDVVASVVDRLVELHLDYPDQFIGKSYYEVLNAWSQKHFGQIPLYELYKQSEGTYRCIIRVMVPHYEDATYETIIEDVDAETRSIARERAARRAYYAISSKGRWIDLRDSGISPNLENSINQLQELYQKKYLTEKAVYEFEEEVRDRWKVTCTVDTYQASGRAENKTKAKKKAAYRVLLHIFMSAGMGREEWIEELYGLGDLQG